jgi:hypothetical protein
METRQVTDKLWKRFERRIGDALGGKRVPVTGCDRDAADVITPLFYVQAKCRRNLPAWLWSWLGGIVQQAVGTGRIGILVLRQPGMRNDDSLVVLRFGDFVSLVGALTPPEDGQ